MDPKAISPGAIQMMLAMTKPMQHLEWTYGGHDEIVPMILSPNLPGRKFNRLNPGYQNKVDDEIMRIMIRNERRFVFPHDVLVLLESKR